MIDYLIFGNVDSRDYNVSVFFKEVDTVAQRAYEAIEIPARNGSVLIDQGRYEDVPHEYDCVALTEADRKRFLNAIVSQTGYQKLQDSFNPDEYYKAVVSETIEPTMFSDRTINAFTLAFTRQPQRWLTIGDIARDVTQQGQSEVIADGYVENSTGKELTSLKVTIPKVHQWSTPTPTSPVAISGWSSLSAKVTGKNRLQHNIGSSTPYGITWTDADGIITATGTATSRSYFVVGWANLVGDYVFTGCPQGGSTDTYHITISYRDTDGVDHLVEDIGSGAVLTDCEYLSTVTIYIEEGTTVDGLEFKPMIRKASESSVFEPYDGTTYTATLKPSGFVYGGTADLVTGELVETWGKIALKDLTWSTASYGGVRYYMSEGSFGYLTASDILCNAFPVGESDDYPTQASPFTDKTMTLVFGRLMVRWDAIDDYITWTRNNDVYLVYKLRNLQTSQFTAPTMALRDGESYVWGDGEVEAFIAEAVGHLVNPTRFESAPLLAVDGYGSISFNGYEIVVNNSLRGKVLLESGGTVPMSKAIFGNGRVNVGDMCHVTMTKKFRWTINSGVPASTLNFIGYPRIVKVENSDPNGRGAEGITVVASSVNKKEIDFTAIVKLDFPWDTWDTTDEYIVTFAARPSNSGSGYPTYTFTFKLDVSAIGLSGDRTEIALTGDGGVSGRPEIVNNMSFDINSTIDYSNVYGDSTVPALGSVNYIDCELGEAYRAGEYEEVSLNKFIEFGSDLPRLATGDNEVEYDDTVTSLLVTPRWYQIG